MLNEPFPISSVTADGGDGVIPFELYPHLVFGWFGDYDIWVWTFPVHRPGCGDAERKGVMAVEELFYHDAWIGIAKHIMSFPCGLINPALFGSLISIVTVSLSRLERISARYLALKAIFIGFPM